MTISKTVLTISRDADPAVQSSVQTTEDEINRVITEVNNLNRSDSGAPTISAARGTLWFRTDASGTSDRIYVNTDGGTAWRALITAT